jgi:hypothetical protein
MLINLDLDFKSVTLEGKAPKIRYIGISRQKGVLLSKRGKNRRKNLGVERHGDCQNQVSPVIILVLFVLVFACFIFGD